MQPLSWYFRRLRSMSPREAAHRALGFATDAGDFARIAAGWRPRPPRSAGLYEGAVRLSDMELGAWSQAAGASREGAWRRALVERAEPLAVRRLTFFDRRHEHLGTPVDWNRDAKSGKRSPMRFARWIDYRDYALTGDCKFIWEPNRHHHLVVLARAYRATGDRRYAEAVRDQLASWLDQCPFATGINWKSPLELGIRLINWVFAIELLHGSEVFSAEMQDRLVTAAYQQVWEICRKYSGGTSANNHLIGEAAGAFVATTYWPSFDPGGRLRRHAHDLLSREILAQTHEDGGSREQAIGYHLFVLQFFLVAGVLGRRQGLDFPSAYWTRLEAMVDFVAALSEAGGTLPMFGDADDGYVLDLDGSSDPRAWLAVGAAVFGRGDFKRASGGWSEAGQWLLGRQGEDRFNSLPGEPPRTLASRAFGPSGQYLLQGGLPPDEAVSVWFDCGELGYGSLAAHGHADALSFTLRAFGHDVLVDPGTYDYFAFPEWRRYFRSTRAHNTVVVDDQDQSQTEGPFLWSFRARASCLRFLPTATGGVVAAEHDGYGRLADPVVHRRTLELEGQTLTIRDEIEAEGEHQITLFFHLGEAVSAQPDGPGRFDLRVAGRRVRLQLDGRFAAQAFRGSESPISGWVSRGYHRRTPTTTLVGRTTSRGKDSFQCRIDLEPPDSSG